MRFSVSMYSRNSAALPRWGRDLARQLEHAGEQAPPEFLGPVTSLRELLACANAVLVGRPVQSGDDRTSLRDDVARALDALGPELSEAAAPALTPLRRELGRIPRLLSEPNGALLVVGLVEAGLEAMADPHLLQSAWDDLRSTYENSASARLCELRTLQLAELAELRGADWRSTAKTISRVLFDDRMALAEIGAMQLPDEGTDDVEKLQEPAGLSLEERFELARGHLTADPPSGEMVAWVCFRNAALRDVYLQLGEIEFFGHQLWPDAIAAGWPGDDPRREFEDEWHRLLFHRLPDEPFVLVRVPLGEGRLTGGGERARAIAQDLVRAAQPNSEWELIKGAAVFVAGEGQGWFGDPLDAHEYPKPGRFSVEYEPTGYELGRIDPAVVEKLVSGDAALHDALRDIEWAETVSSMPDALQQLALSTRLIERTLPAPEGEHWTEPVRRYLRDWWIEQEARSLVADAAHGAVDLLDSTMSSDNASRGWRRRLMPGGGAEGYQILLDETIRVAGQLAADLPDGSLQGRIAKELASHSESPASWTRLLDERGRAFTVLLARLVRQRNAVLHGSDTVPAVVRSVVPFALRLQALVMHTQLDAATAGESLLTALERNRIRLERIRYRLAAGEPPDRAMFSDAPT